MWWIGVQGRGILSVGRCSQRLKKSWIWVKTTFLGTAAGFGLLVVSTVEEDEEVALALAGVDGVPVFDVEALGADAFGTAAFGEALGATLVAALLAGATVLGGMLHYLSSPCDGPLTGGTLEKIEVFKFKFKINTCDTCDKSRNQSSNHQQRICRSSDHQPAWLSLVDVIGSPESRYSEGANTGGLGSHLRMPPKAFRFVSSSAERDQETVVVAKEAEGDDLHGTSNAGDTAQPPPRGGAQPKVMASGLEPKREAQQQGELDGAVLEGELGMHASSGKGETAGTLEGGGRGDPTHSSSSSTWIGKKHEVSSRELLIKDTDDEDSGVGITTAAQDMVVQRHTSDVKINDATPHRRQAQGDVNERGGTSEHGEKGPAEEVHMEEDEDLRDIILARGFDAGEKVHKVREVSFAAC